MLLAVMTALGVGLWLSALNVKYRDVRHTLGFLTQVWFFVTPVTYPSSIVPEAWRALYGLNPMAGVVEGFRWALLGKAEATRRAARRLESQLCWACSSADSTTSAGRSKRSLTSFELMTDYAISCLGLSKQYCIGERASYATLRDTLTNAMYAPVRRLRSVFNGGNGASSDRRRRSHVMGSSECFV